MSSRKTIKELEGFREQVLKLADKMARAGEIRTASDLYDVAIKLDQKIDGHRANLKRKK